MAKIENSKPKKDPRSYEMVLGDADIARLCQQTQSTIISSGNDLEKIISEECNERINDLDLFLDKCEDENQVIKPGIYYCSKKTFKNYSERIQNREPDMLLFSIDNNKRNCYILELKLGTDFDTKKSESERDTLEKCVSILGPKLSFKTQFKFCCFNAASKEEIVAGTKNKFNIEQVWTGQDLCKELGVNYIAIKNRLSSDSDSNYSYFVNTVTNTIYHKHIFENDFYDDE